MTIHTPSTATLTRRYRSVRAFTLPELSIASALVGLIMAATVMWVAGLLNLATTQATVTRPRQAATFVHDQLTYDLQNAMACSPAGISSTLLAIDADELHLWVATSYRNPSTGQLEAGAAQVAWLYDGARAQLSRSESEPVARADTSCTLDQLPFGTLPSVSDGLATPEGAEPVSWTPVASYVTAAGSASGPGRPVFSGTGGPRSGWSGSCTGSTADFCLFTTIRMQARVGSATDAGVDVDRAVRLNTTSSRL